MNTTEIIAEINKGGLDGKLSSLYGKTHVEKQRERYIGACASFEKLYGERNNIRIFSAPGRTEVIGNHTDHNSGKVVAAAVDLDVIAIVSETDDNIIRIKSEGYPEDVIDVSLPPFPSKDSYFTSAALISGLVAGISNRGYKVGGFCAYTTSNVLKGSGLSSSAAFEVLVGSIINHLYCGGKLSPVQIAKLSQYAENNYFGKPSGLMDQTACACGGLVAIDFLIPDKPEIEKLEFSPAEYGYTLAIVSAGGNHADLNDDYAAIPAEMKKVAKYFGKEVLRDIDITDVYASISNLRAYASDRAVLRAIHFFNENDRVDTLKDAVKEKDIGMFLRTVEESGRSSYDLLQNIYSAKNPVEQGIAMALVLTGIITHDSAYRVHGGGFAGTIQAYVKEEEFEDYEQKMNSVFGKNACRQLSFRNDGAVEIEI